MKNISLGKDIGYHYFIVRLFRKLRSRDAHGQRGSHETISTRPLCEQLTFVIVCAMCFPHVNDTNIKIESLFFGGVETSTLLEWGGWTEAGDKLMCLLGAFLIHPRRVPRKEQFSKQFQHLGLTLVTLVTCFVPP